MHYMLIGYFRKGNLKKLGEPLQNKGKQNKGPRSVVGTCKEHLFSQKTPIDPYTFTISLFAIVSVF